MAIPDTDESNSRIAYKVVTLITLWVDEGPEHDAIVNLSKQILEHEVTELLDGAGFRIGETGYGFTTAVNSIEFVQRTELH
jgi:hypothetical protein|tara:strand:+ start:1477 stop:1719 length:243 start_codon:yes stop_codon:yes gene_type:complete